MSNDEKVEELSKKLDTKLTYSDDLTKIDKKPIKPSFDRLKKLTKDFRENLEDYIIEPTTYTITSKQSK